MSISRLITKELGTSIHNFRAKLEEEVGNYDEF